jgi:hypothetical protein
MFQQRTAFLFCLLLSLLVLSGCQTIIADSPNANHAIPEVMFVAENGAFHGPDSIQAGWVHLYLENKGPAYDHIQLLKLKDGKTIDDLLAALDENPAWPAWTVAVGGPNAPDPGARSSAHVYLAEGDYALVSWVPGPDGRPRYMNGMIAALAVTGANLPSVSEPNADVVMELLDFSFSLSKPLSTGVQTIQVRNEGTHPHEVWLARLAPEKTVADLFASLAPDAPPEAWDTSGIGGITEIQPGEHAYFTVDLEPGHYVIVCFVFDHDAANVHAGLGMVQEFVVQ